jgi:hypothetical protein
MEKRFKLELFADFQTDTIKDSEAGNLYGLDKFWDFINFYPRAKHLNVDPKLKKFMENFNNVDESSDKFPIAKSDSGETKSRKGGSRKSSESDSKGRGPRKQSEGDKSNGGRGPRKQSEGDKSNGGRGPRKQSEGEKGKNKAKNNSTSEDTDSQQSQNGPRVNPTGPRKRGKSENQEQSGDKPEKPKQEAKNVGKHKGDQKQHNTSKKTDVKGICKSLSLKKEFKIA